MSGEAGMRHGVPATPARRVPAGLPGTSLRRSLRTLLAPLGRHSAYSWPVAAVFLAISSAKQLLSDAPAIGGPYTAWIATSALSALAFGLVFVTVGAVVRRAPAPSPFAVLAGYALAGAARALSAGLAASFVGLADDALPDFRLMALVSNTLLLGVAGYVAGRHDRHRAVLAEMEGHRHRLVEAERQAGFEFERVRAELSGAARASLEPAVRALDAALAAAAGARTTDALLRLERFVEDEVRPLSRRLLDEPVEVVSPATSATTAMPPPVPFPTRYRLADGLRPELTAATIAVVILPTAIRDLSPVEVVEYASIGTGFTWATLALIRRGFGGRDVPVLPGIALLVALHAAIPAIALGLFGVVGIPHPDAMLLMAPIAVGIVGGLIAIGDVVETRRAATEAERNAVVARLEEAVALATRRGRVARVQLARVIHGSLQGELYAAAMRLRETPSPSAAVLAEVRAAVAAALAHLESDDHHSGRTQTTLEAIAATWEGLRTITSLVDRGAERALAADPLADEAVAEVVREAVNNALRHGGARSVAIAVALDGETGRTADGVPSPARGRLTVRIRDDGSGWSPEAAPGQGTTLFDELCRPWTHESDERGTTFHGFIPLS